MIVLQRTKEMKADERQTKELSRSNHQIIHFSNGDPLLRRNREIGYAEF